MDDGLVLASATARGLRDELNAVEDRLARQRDALVGLTAAKLADCGALAQSLGRILEVSADTLGVARASLWRFDRSRTKITCTDLYESASRRHSSGLELCASDYPLYFTAVDASDVIAADDAGTDPRTRDFATTYLQPLGITSMLDAPVHANGEIIGVICHEHVGPKRRWTADERSFVTAISNLLALALESCERQRVESTAALQAAALDAAADATVITDRDGVIVWANPAFTTLTGYQPDEWAGRHPGDLLRSGQQDLAYYEKLWQTLLAGKVWRGEMLNRRKDGSTYAESQTITPVRNAAGEITNFIAVKRDLTEKRGLEAQFLQAQKMEVVGRLAGGVAHDFNNLLTVINGTAELALMDLVEPHSLREDFLQIRDAGLRAASLTRQLLAFSRKQIAKRESVELGRLVADFHGILQRLIGEDIRLHVQGESQPACILGDPSQIEQVILNLAVNSRDAMPTGGDLWLEVGRVELDDDFVASHVGARTGPHARLVVRDSGSGMTPEVMAKIFEPFFTTKDPGKGTGLGLATAYAIVEQCGGTIWVRSEVGHGTTFEIYFPQVGEPQRVATDSAPSMESGDETVLLVEDEEPVRELGARILEAAGYTVLTASDSAGALATLQLPDIHVDIIVSDVVLRGEGGRGLVERALAIQPGLAVLFTSGYTTDVVLAHGVRDNTAAFISKPYTPMSLSNRVRAVLSERKAASAPASAPQRSGTRL